MKNGVLFKSKQLYLQDFVFPFFLPYLLPLIHIALTGSVYTTIAVAVERCITVLAPFTSIKVRQKMIKDLAQQNHLRIIVIK